MSAAPPPGQATPAEARDIPLGLIDADPEQPRTAFDQAAADAPYQFLPPLSDEEYSALRADIAARGILIPIEFDEDGAILDGHHRAQIAVELGIEAPTITRRFASEGQKREHVIKMNLARRHLDPIRWARAFAALLAERGIALGQGARNDRATSATVAEVAAELGVPARTARDRLAQARSFDALPPEAQARVASGGWDRQTLREEARQVRREQRAERWRARRSAGDEWLARRQAARDQAGDPRPVRFVGHLDLFDTLNGYEVLPLGSASSPTPAEWAPLVTALTPPMSPIRDLHPDLADLSVTGDSATRPLAWRGGTLLLPTGRWVGAWLTTTDGQREVRRWWEWDELPAREARVIRDEADVQQYAARHLTLRRLMRPPAPAWFGHPVWPDYVDADDLEDALAADLAAVRAWRATAQQNLHDAATVYALGERMLTEWRRSSSPWQRFAQSLPELVREPVAS